MRPLIGISTYREQAQWGVWDQSADLLPTAYAESVERAGGVPLLLPPTTPYDAAARAVVSRLDGLVIAGGADVAATAYGEPAHPEAGAARPDRDQWEFALLRAADHRGLPTLGVCRGIQVMAVEAGGGLVQHLPDQVGHEEHSPGGDRFGSVDVRIADDSLLRSVLGTDDLAVHCHHHQSVSSHPGYAAVAWAGDGVVEAMERPGVRFCVGVQWHPEVAADAGLFKALVVAAARPGG
ncbi:MAG: gamma-glutamyl-gamma-aminobutyrate hydrolase family protein [Alphaproteobacteria bacterium]|nr:gamma-glutamyl-gamma-aminobutyrate hydrolase family protein [Alphaproteobacteria bacterium]